MHIDDLPRTGVVMSELEIVEREYRALATRVIYGGFDGTVDDADEARLESLGERRLDLSAPDLSAILRV